MAGFKQLLTGAALLRASAILKDKNKLDNLTQKASAQMDALTGAALSLRDDLAALLGMLRGWARGEYRDVPWKSMLTITGAVVYFVNPMDAVPDFLPVMGLVDDATVVGFVVAAFKDDIENYKSHNVQSDALRTI